MKRFRVTLAALVAGTAGILAALTLTAPAFAWNIHAMPNGYSVIAEDHGPCGSGSGTYYTVIWSASGQQADLGTDCAPDFQQRLDDFVNATCPCAQTTTSTPAPATTDEQPPAGTTTTGNTTTVTTTVTATVADPTVDARLTAIEQRQQVNEARIAALEAKVGLIVPEAKNQMPFTRQVA